MTGPEDFDRVGDLLGDFCEAAATPEPPKNGAANEGPSTGPLPRRTPGEVARALAELWPEIAGAEVAANASPVQLKAGRLVVSTSSSVWAHTLQYMSEDLRIRLNTRLGAGTVQQIMFRHAGWEERPRTAVTEYPAVEPVASGTLSLEQTQALEQLEQLDLPQAIREKMERAMRASFARTQRDSVR
jgi:hypothetical protein